MPRPPLRNRHRQNSFALRSPQPRKPTRVPHIPDPAQIRQHLDTQLAGKAAGKKPVDSDDSDQLVTTRASGRNRKRQEIYASGGVGKADKPGAYPTKAQRTRSMREDTQEILNQRSRSASRSLSRANSEQSLHPTPVRSSSPREKGNAASGGSDSRVSKGVADKESKQPKSQEKVNGQQSSHIPVMASVREKLKIRKHQDSLLKPIQADGIDDSTLVIGDKAEFSPDAVSTPLIATRTATPQRSSLKRKRVSELLVSLPDYQSMPLSNPSVRKEPSVLQSSPDIPQPSRSQRRKLTTSSAAQGELDSIMAPPESSDSEDAGEELLTTNSSVTKSKRGNPSIPSTEALQNLMPSRKREPLRRRRPKDDFDLPENSSSSSDVAMEADENENEPSIFLPRTARSKQRRAPVPAKTVQRSRKRTNGVTTQTRMKRNAKSTNTIFSATPSPVRVRTPLPLSSVKASARSTQAKSPSKQGNTVMRDKTSEVLNTPMGVKATAAKGKTGRKQYGGFRPRELGKENEPAGLSEKSSNENNTDGIGQSIEDLDEQPTTRTDGPEIKAWKKKWANIDDFQMEVEEVSISTRSSSPTAR